MCLAMVWKIGLRVTSIQSEVGYEEETPICLIIVDKTPAAVLKMVREVIL